MCFNIFGDYYNKGNIHIGVGSNVVCSTTIGNARASVRGTDNKDVPTLFCVKCLVKSLTSCHRDMEFHKTQSDVKQYGGSKNEPPCARLTSNALPKIPTSSLTVNSHTGVSTHYILSDCPSEQNGTCQWFALRTTYGREKKAYDYLVAHNIIAYYPTLKRVQIINGKKVNIEASRIPNIFFAYGTEEKLKAFVYDNINLPYLRFYYRHTHVGHKIIMRPLIIPSEQMNSLKIICAAESDDIVASTDAINKFKQGQKVRIIDGKFKGVTGIFARYQSQKRVGIVIDRLFTICTAYIPSAFVEEC